MIEFIGCNKLTRIGLSLSGLLLLSLLGLLSILGCNQLLRALVASVAYYMIPMGVGLLLLPDPTKWRMVGLREGERLLAAYFGGLVALTLFYIIRDRYGFAQNYRYVIDLVALFLAIVGWCLDRRHALSHFKLLLTSRHALLAFAVYLVGFGVQFFILSDYPYTDLFQFTHILKGTEEFLKWDRLNPFVADSYIPAIPVVLRLVAELTGAENLPTIWMLSLCSFVIRWMAIFLLIRRLPHMHRYAGLVAAIALPFFLSGVPTNGELVSLGGCLILSLSLASMQSQQTSYKWLPLFAVPVSLVLAIILSSAVDVALYGGFALVGVFALNFFGIRRTSGASVTLGLMCFLMAPLHRSSLVFFTVAVFSSAGLCNFASRYWLNPLVVRTILGIVLALVGAVLLRWLGIGDIPDIGITLAQATKNSLGVDFLTDANRSAGVGSKIALFEVARSVGLFLYVLGFVCLLKIQPIRRLMNYQFVAGCLLLLVLLGLPFVYRAAFFLPILLAAIVVYQFYESSPTGHWLTGSAISIYSIVLLTASVMQVANGGISSGGQERIAPVLLCIVLAASAIAFLMYVRQMDSKTMVALILVTASLVDRQFIRAQFMHYAYPSDSLGVSVPLSHYDANDIKIAAFLKSIPGEIVVISDPLTMANMRGLGGHNSLLLFTNLDTGSVVAKQELYGYMKYLGRLPEGGVATGCLTLAKTLQVLAVGQSPDLAYTLLRRNSPDISSKDILFREGYSNSLKLTLSGRPEGIVGTPNGRSASHWESLLIPDVLSEAIQTPDEEKIRFAIVINNRTADWVASTAPVSQTYFPVSNSLNDVILKRLQLECNAVLIANSAIIIFDFNGNMFNAP